MLKPTKDKELVNEMTELIGHAFYCKIPINKQLCGKVKTCNECIAIKITELLDEKGYHIGLPSDIEWALNSGNGVYRP